jgi:hypothetical protein
MSRLKTLQELFKRYRRPGDIVFAWALFVLAVALASQINTQSPWNGTRNMFSQPAFWPTVSLLLMVVFTGLHLLSSALSPRILGRWAEVAQWLRAVEFAGWFLLYVYVVPYLGYLPTTVLAALLLGVRMGYRSVRSLGVLVAMGTVIVVTFRGFLQVRVPAGEVYQYLPDTVRIFFMTYL